MSLVLRGATLFDGADFREGDLLLCDGRVAAILPPGERPDNGWSRWRASSPPA